VKYLLDTDICVYLIRKNPAHVLKRLASLRIGDVGISAITFSELRFGAENSLEPESNRQLLLEFVAPLEMLDYPADAAATYGRLRAALTKIGKMIGPLDMLIASHAVHLDSILVTNNISEFSRIPDLRLENWVRPK
jgi:tRNA(fMet)-specific endonuclease VapC